MKKLILFFSVCLLFFATGQTIALANGGTEKNTLSLNVFDGLLSNDDSLFREDYLEEMFLPVTFRQMRNQALFDNYVSIVPYASFEEGVISTGQENPWILSKVGLAAQRYYIETCEEKYKTLAFNIRDWILERIIQDDVFPDVYYIPYAKPNEDYATGQGTRYFSSLSEPTAMHFLLRFNDYDVILIENLLKKFFKTSDNFGLYSLCEGYVNWEEIATTVAPSLVLNGGQIGGYQIDQVIKLLPESLNNERNALITLNNSYKAFNLEYAQPSLFLKIKGEDQLYRDVIRYDYKDLKLPYKKEVNTRELNHYSFRIARDYFLNLEMQGYTLNEEVKGHLLGDLTP